VRVICVCLVYSYLNDNHKQKVKEVAEEVMEDRGDEVPVWLSSEQKPVPAAYPVLRNFEPDIDTFYEDWLGKKTPDRR